MAADREGSELLTRLKVADLRRDLAREAERHRHVFAERDQQDLVIPSRRFPGGINHLSRVQRLALRRPGNGAEQYGAASHTGQRVHPVPEVRVAIVVKRRGHFRPQNHRCCRLIGGQRTLERKILQPPLHLVDVLFVPLFLLVDIGLQRDRRLCRTRYLGQRRQRVEHRQNQNPDQFPPGPAQRDHGDAHRHQREHKREPVNPCQRGQPHRNSHVDPGVAQLQPHEPERCGNTLGGHPERRDGRGRVPLMNHHSGQHAEHRHVDAGGQAEQQEHAEAARISQASVNGHHELDPVAHGPPEHRTGNVAQQEPVLRTVLARQRDQQRSQCERGQPDQVPAGMNRGQQKPADHCQQQVQHAVCEACSLTISAM